MRKRPCIENVTTCDNMFALLNEANENVKFAMKTLNRMTKTRSIINKIMQLDVMAPLLSSNFIDVNIVKIVKTTENIYMFKYNVPFPPCKMIL